MLYKNKSLHIIFPPGEVITRCN